VQSARSFFWRTASKTAFDTYALTRHKQRRSDKTPTFAPPEGVTAGGVDRGAGRQYDLAPDGRFLIDTELNDSSPITLLQHWDPSRTK
jgi:hypothetical protein